MADDISPPRGEVTWPASTGRLLTFWLPVGCIIAGSALRLWQYAGRASLFVDEAALARNIIDRPLRLLLGAPLAFDQVAAPGFLLVEKGAVTLLGNTEYALRLFPVACGILSLVLVWRIARRLLPGIAVAGAVALMAFAPGLIFFTCIVKQYSSDVAASLVVLLLALDLRSGVPTWGRAWRTGVAGIVLVGFSQPAVMTVVGLGAALVALAVLDRNTAALRRVAVVASLWGLGAAGAVLASRRVVTVATRDFMHVFWNEGFLPLPIRARTAAHWVWDQTNLTPVPAPGFANRWPIPFIAVAALGFVWICKRRRDHATLLIAPVVATLAAGAVQQYPFAGRLTLFLTPSLVLAVAAAVPLFGSLARKHQAIISGLAATLIVLPVADALRRAHPVYDEEPFTPAMSYLASARRPGDKVYVYYGGAQAFAYYAPRFGLGRDDYVIGGCHRSDPAAYLRELDGFRGTPRLWVVIGHAFRPSEAQAITGYLGRIGVSHDSLVVLGPPHSGQRKIGSRVELYDLGNADHLGARRDTAALPPHESVDPAFNCAGGPTAYTRDSLARH